MENSITILLAINWLFLLYNFSTRRESYVSRRHSHFYEPIYSEDGYDVTGYFCMGCGISSNKNEGDNE